MRPVNATLEALFPGRETQSTVDIKLISEATPYYFSTNVAFTASGNSYVPLVLRVGELKETQNTATNRVRVTLSNVDKTWGLKLASDLRKLEMANVVIKRLFRSRSNLATNTHQHFFTGKLVNAEANEREINFDVIPDTTASGFCIATENLTPANGWRFPEAPTASSPGTGDNPGGGIGGGGCFGLETEIKTKDGSIVFGDLPLGVPEKRISLVSFDLCGKINIDDEVLEVAEHEVNEFFTLHFERGTVKVTPKHPFLTKFGHWTRAEDFSLSQTTKIFNGIWAESRLIGFSYHRQKTLVRSMRTGGGSYFANNFAVKNSKDPNFPV
jgi:hypothetical protein